MEVAINKLCIEFLSQPLFLFFCVVGLLGCIYSILKNLKSNKKISEIIKHNKEQKNNEVLKEYICPQCGGKLIKKVGKYGEFLGCSNFPKCRYTKNNII